MQVPLLEAMNSLMQVMMMITGGWMPSVGSAAGLVHVPTGVLLLEVRGGAAAPEASEASLVMKQLVTESREPAFKSLAVWTAVVVVVVVAAVVALYYQLARMKQSPTPSKPRVPVDKSQLEILARPSSRALDYRADLHDFVATNPDILQFDRPRMGALTATDVPVAVAAASLMKQNNPHVYMRVFGGLTARKDRAVASLDRKGPPLLGKLYSSIIKDLQDSFKF